MENHRGLGRAKSTAGGLALALGLVATAACGQADPEAPAGAEQPYFPLVAGSYWTYEHSDWSETVTLEAAEHAGAPAFLMSDSPNPDDDLRSDSIITSVNGRASRMTKDEYAIDPATGAATLTASVSYGVGFTRFNESWANQAVGYRETPEYERVETRPGQPPRPAEARRHTFEIVEVDAEVTTPRGTFRCIVIQRTKDWEAEAAGDGDEADTKRYWFARGVGKVQELNVLTGNTETLTDYMIPEQSPDPAPVSY